MKNCRQSRRWIFINNFFDMGKYENKNDTIGFASSSRFETCTFKLERSIGKFDLRSGQVKVRSKSDHDTSRSICTSSEVVRRAKSFGTICVSLSPSYRDLLAKNGLWRHLTSSDLPVTPDRQLHPDLHRWGEWPWSWRNWLVLIGLYETGSIFIFPHLLYV